MSKPKLLVSHQDAEILIQKQIDDGMALQINVPIEGNPVALTWYEYTKDLLRQICSNEDLAGDFDGKNEIGIAFFATTQNYLRRLHSIKLRLRLYTVVNDEISNTSNYQIDIERLISKFHMVARQLTYRHSNRETIIIKDEYDAQDLLHALLKLYFEDIRPEEWVPSYAGSSSRTDFLLKKEQTVIEIKKTRANLKTKEIGEQLIIDKAKYKIHPDCKCLICFVYDPDEFIVNPRGIENDLNESDDKFIVKVYISQK